MQTTFEWQINMLRYVYKFHITLQFYGECGQKGSEIRWGRMARLLRSFRGSAAMVAKLAGGNN
jgi:2'-5' RNA ligase